MDTEKLKDRLHALIHLPKGILAIDESPHTCNERFEQHGIEPTEENRRAYRELIIAAPHIEEYISGMILAEETFHQKMSAGVSFIGALQEKGIAVGIKVDQGTTELALHPGEKVTEGLDSLPERLADYKNAGATFTKWRAVIRIDKTHGLPSEADIHANAHALARYAALVQDAGLIPIVEPEVLMDGPHTIEECFSIMSTVLDRVFEETRDQGVLNAGLILKTAMVISGKDCPIQATSEQIVEKTLGCLLQHVPKDVGAVVFLSGGQNEEAATENLRGICAERSTPWPMTFSYGRAIQNPALKIWASDQHRVSEAQEALVAAAKNNSAAVTGAIEQQTAAS